MADVNEPLDVNQAVVSGDSKPTPVFEDAFNELKPLFDTGSPAGVVAANPGRFYVDLSGGAGGVLYVKQSGTDTSGWVLV